MRRRSVVMAAGRRRIAFGFGLVVLLPSVIAGCRPTPAGADPAPQPVARPADAEDSPPSPTSEAEAPAADDGPISTPATVRVDHLVGHPARWHEHTVFAVGRLVFQANRCTRSEPPSCTGQWWLVDAESAGKKPQRLRIDAVSPVEPVCRPAGTGLVAPSPCWPGEIDPTVSLRVRGVFRAGADGPSLAAESFERVAAP